MARLLRFVLLLALFGTAAQAQTPGSCMLGEAEADLSANNVQARLFTTGALAYGNTSEAAYTVPRDAEQSPLYAANLWVGGRVDGEVRAAGATFSNFEFWPGPLGDDGRPVDASDCSAYDRIWVVSRADVDRYEAGQAPTDDLRDWPTGLGAATVDASGQPVVPTSRDRVIDLAAGERPVVYGSQTAFWVMNDVGNVHESTGSAPLGVEVQMTAFAANSYDAAFDNTTVYRYRIVNRSSNTIEEAHATLWGDLDLGDAGAHIGSDPARGMVYAYEGDEDDLVYEIPPAFGIDALTGAASSGYAINGVDPPLNDPTSAAEFYNVQQGLWKDGTPITVGGTGFRSDGAETVWPFPADPVTAAFWSQENVDGEGTPAPNQNQRGLINSPAFDLAPGEAYQFDVAFVFAQGQDRLDSVVELRELDDRVQAAYDDGSLFDVNDPVGLLSAPGLSEPADGAHLDYRNPVVFRWESVAGATGYDLQIQIGEPFETAEPQRVGGPDTLSATRDDFLEGEYTVYWRVVASAPGHVGTPSPVRSFTYVGYDAEPLLFDPSGSESFTNVAFVEVQGPGGVDPCGPDAASTDGCDTFVGGNLIYQSLNSTEQYIGFSSDGTYGTGPEGSVSFFAPNDFEIRFTEAGSYAVYALTTGRLVRVPFEVWDVGPIDPPSTENDPADDRQIIPVLRAQNGTGAAAECEFGFAAESIFERGGVSQEIFAYYPVGGDYAAFEAEAEALLAADADGCVEGATASAAADLIDLERGRPLQGFVLEDATGDGYDVATGLTGSIIRFYSGAPPPVLSAGEDDGVAAPDVIGVDVYPNPMESAATVAFETVRPGEAFVRVVDVLGREVAVLWDGPIGEGVHRVPLLTRQLASGLYVVEVTAGGERSTRTVTVVR